MGGGKLLALRSRKTVLSNGGCIEYAVTTLDIDPDRSVSCDGTGHQSSCMGQIERERWSACEVRFNGRLAERVTLELPSGGRDWLIYRQHVAKECVRGPKV